MSYADVQRTLNPRRYHLSREAEKRLRWMYVVERRCAGNLTQAADALHVSREWLTKLHRRFIRSRRDPRTLESRSRAPRDCSKRKRTPPPTVEMIVSVRRQYPAWGKEKIARILARTHGVTVSPTTVGRYLTKKRLINPRISEKNRRAWNGRRERGVRPSVIRERSPSWLADAAPGSLIQKDMKLIGKPGCARRQGKERLREYFWYQHTMVDATTRLRVLALAQSADSRTAAAAYRVARGRFPFPIAALQSDNGGENEKHFAALLEREGVLHFWSRPGTPTDNPRVERSHRSDDEEFYGQGNRCRTFEEQAQRLREWERTWNDVRPHQALGYLTPNEYCALWMRDREEAIRIQRRWRTHLARQRRQQQSARRAKKQERLRAISDHLSAVLGPSFTPLEL